ncbi:MAG: hypothetical protein C5B54_08530 [Acidobacteria bacterium]|nr:MAG: hypothetical protein C5B54_08530 [Acidobacteriota bacterium]
MFEMRVDDVFTISGVGTVLTGFMQSGSISVGDQAVCKTRSRELKIRVAGLVDASSKPIKIAENGSTVGVICKQLDLSIFSDSLQSRNGYNVIEGVTLSYAPKSHWWG